MSTTARKGESSFGEFIVTKAYRNLDGSVRDMSGHTVTARIFEEGAAPRTGGGVGTGQTAEEGGRLTYKTTPTDFPDRGKRYGVVLYAAIPGENLESGIGYVTVTADDEPR